MCGVGFSPFAVSTFFFRHNNTAVTFNRLNFSNVELAKASNVSVEDLREMIRLENENQVGFGY